MQQSATTVTEAVLSRRSVRGFLDTVDVPRDDPARAGRLEAALAAAAAAVGNPGEMS
jgi:nitroreductase